MKRLVTLLWLGCWWLTASSVQAQVVINEVYPQPPSGEPEWVELKNTGSESLNLAGWTLEDILSSPKQIFLFESMQLEPNQLVLASFSGQLNNNGDGVVLKDQAGLVISQMSYATSSLGLSWSLDQAGTFVLATPSPNLPNPSVAASPTPTASPTLMPTPSPSASPTPLPSPTFSPSPNPSPPPVNFEQLAKLQLFRASPCPKEGSEWLEWWNQASEPLKVNVVIRDLQSNSIPLFLEVGAQAKLVTTLPRHIFNNSGDELFVYVNETFLWKRSFPACDQHDTIFSFSPDNQWPQVGGFDGEVAQTGALSDQGGVAALSDSFEGLSPLETKTESLDQESFILPQVEGGAAESSTAAQVDGQFLARTSPTGQVLGQTTSLSADSALSNFGPPLLLIWGGLFWLGLGIMEVYDRGSQNQIMA